MVLSIIIIVLCLVAFAVIHSITASLPVKRYIIGKLGPGAEKLYMSVYSLIAIITILPLAYLLYMNPGPFLYIVPSPWRWLMVAVQLTAGLFAPMALRDAPHRFMIDLQLAGPKSPKAASLNIKGIYRWIRDPFFLSGLIIMVFTPFMTVNLLVVYILTTIYLYIGSRHWESRLISQFGDEYREYQKKVHRIVPHLKAYHDQRK